MVRGLVHGMVMRIFRLSSDPFEALTDCKRFGQRLVARGYSAGFVFDLINKSIKTWSHDCSPVRRPSTACTAAPLFLHVPYHPMSPASTKIQALFRQDFFPLDGTILPHHRNPKTLARFGVERLIIAYSRPRNLGNNFSPRKLSGPGVAVSAIIDDMRRYRSASNPNPSFP